MTKYSATSPYGATGFDAEDHLGYFKIRPIPSQADVPTTESQLPRNQSNELERSPVQTRSRTGTTVHPPDRLTF